MTNEEKAYEISQSPLIEDGIWHYATAEIAAITMAEWKDQQLNEQKAIGDAELAEVRRQRDAYYDELLKLRVEKLEWIDKALDAHCEYCDHTCPHNGMECYIRENIRKSMEK